MKRYVLITISVALIGLLSACPEPKDTNDIGQNTDTDQNTTVVFDNRNGTCAVDVYRSHLRTEDSKIVTIPAGQNSNEFKWSPGSSVPFFFTYKLNLIGINDLTIDFIPEIGKDQTYIRVDANKINTIPVPTLAQTASSTDALLSDSTFLVIQNNSSFSINLLRGNSILTPFNISDTNVNPGELAHYVLIKSDSKTVSHYQISENGRYSPFPVSGANFEAGRIYSFVYNGSGIDLISIFEIKLDNVVGGSLDDPGNKTYVRFINENEFPVNIFTNISRNNKLIEVAAQSQSSSIQINPNISGALFYPTYNIVIEDITIPYDAGVIVARIDAGKSAATPNIVTFTNLEYFDKTILEKPLTNSAYIKIHNNASSSLSLRYNSSNLIPHGALVSVVNGMETVYYIVTPGNASNYTFMQNTTNPISFPGNVTNFESGRLYSFRFDGVNLVLLIEKPLMLFQAYALSPPENISARSLPNGQIILNWGKVSVETSYRIYRAEGSPVNFSQIGSATSTSYTDNTVVLGKTYYYKINSAKTNLESELSEKYAEIISGNFMEMVWINAGTFQMDGTDSGGTSRPVTISKGFSMGKYEVTQEQYHAVMGTNPSYFSGSPASGETQGRRPVEGVRWYEAIVFCNRLSMMEGLSPAYSIGGSTNPDTWGTVPTSSNATWNAVTIVGGSTGYRLPTEAEWEYACRAGTTTAWSFGSAESQAANYAWYGSNSNSMTHEVGKKQPNAWGLHDMHGNVEEWCWDWYGDYYSSGAQTDPRGAASGSYRVLRGGDYSDWVADTRSARRHGTNPSDRTNSIGFRLVRPDPSVPFIAVNTQPTATTSVTVGSNSGSLSVSASVTLGATLSYQWYSSTTNSNSGGTEIGGETNASFAIPTTLAVGTYYYFCEVRATGGAASVRSNVATVTVSATVTFNKNNTDAGSTEANPATKTVTPPATNVATLPANPIRSGWTFAGWNTAANGSGTAFTASTAVTGNITVYARWIESSIVSSSGIELLLIPAGTFTMGSPTSEANRGSDETQHQVTLSKGFCMGKYEVTQEQYQAVMGTNPSYFSVSPASGEIQARRPVERVTWFDAVEFCNKLSQMEGLTVAYTITNRSPASGYPITSATVTANWSANGYRLPTEAEWEYACRAGTTTAWSFGSTDSQLGNYAWYSSNSSSMTHEVGKKQPNAWGLHDMHGNVEEWCWDWDGSYSSGAQTDPTGAVSGPYRVLRGGSWNFDARYLRSASRNGIYPYNRSNDVGFRLVRP